MIFSLFNNIIFNYISQLLKSTGAISNLPISNLSTFLNCLNHLMIFLTYQYLLYQHLIQNQINQLFLEISDVSTPVTFLSQTLLHNKTNLIQFLFYLCYGYVVLENNSFYITIFFINQTVKRIIVAFPCNHGTIIQTGISCKRGFCYMRNSACRWLIVKNAKIFQIYVKDF